MAERSRKRSTTDLYSDTESESEFEMHNDRRIPSSNEPTPPLSTHEDSDDEGIIAPLVRLHTCTAFFDLFACSPTGAVLSTAMDLEWLRQLPHARGVNQRFKNQVQLRLNNATVYVSRTGTVQLIGLKSVHVAAAVANYLMYVIARPDIVYSVGAPRFVMHKGGVEQLPDFKMSKEDIRDRLERLPCSHVVLNPRYSGVQCWIDADGTTAVTAANRKLFPVVTVFTTGNMQWCSKDLDAVTPAVIKVVNALTVPLPPP